MDNIKIPVWLLALAFSALVLVMCYSIIKGEPVYIHGKPWGISKKITESDLITINDRIRSLETEPKYGGSYQKIDDGFPTTNQFYNPLTAGLSCPNGFASEHVGRVRAAEPEVGANQYVCIKKISVK